MIMKVGRRIEAYEADEEERQFAVKGTMKEECSIRQER